jgi:hypothetical protein
MSKKSFKIDKSIVLKPVDLTTLTSPQEGELAIDINDSNKLKKYSTISSTWVEIGSGGTTTLSSLTDVTLTSPINEQYIVYDTSTSKWINKTQSLEDSILLRQNFDYALTTDFTQTGLAISTANPIRGLKSAQLISAGVTQSFKKVLAVDPEFRGKNNTLSIYTRSSATQGNVTILIYDETNAANLAASQAITLGSTTITATTTSASATLSAISTTDINKLKVGQTITGAGIPTGTIISAISTSTATMSQSASASATITAKISALPARQAFTFDIPNNCASISYTISALAETGSPESYFDDISIKLTEVAKTTASVTVPKAVLNTDAADISSAGVLLSTTANFIQSITNPSAGNYVITFVSGYFSVTPAINVTIASTASTAPVITAQSASSVSITLYDTVPRGSAVSAPFNIHVTKQGVDFVNPLTATESKTIDLTSAQLVQTPDSYLQMNGFGASLASTATQIMYLTSNTIVSNVGDAIQYVSDSVNGDKFIALRDGEFKFNLSGDFISAAGVIGLSKNTTQLTTAYNSLSNASERLMLSTNSDIAVISWSGKLNTGDTLRLHNVNATGISAGYATSISFSYNGALKQLNFSTDSKITIPTHQLRFEGASSRGSTDTAIVKFDTQAITQGDAWSVVNTAANGTVITMLKAGKLSVSTNLIPSGAGSSIQITKNQQTKTAISAVASEIMASSYIGIAARPHASSTFDVNVGDAIRVTAESAPSANVGNMITLSLTETSIPANFSNVLPQWSQSDSAIQLNTANGYGSTGTKIRRFSNTFNNIGTAITYVDSATNGASFTINEDGLYSITYTDIADSGGGTFGISKNASSLSVNITSLTAPEMLANQLVPVGTIANCAWSNYLLKGDVIRPHSEGMTSTQNKFSNFQISKVGKPNLSSVDVTSFVNMKTTDTEAIEALTATSTFGSTNTGVPVLSITKNTNLGVIRVDSSAANGTSFVALKDCEVKISTAFSAVATTSASVYITRNATILTSTAPDGQIRSGTNQTGTTNTDISANIKLVAGDTLRIQKSGATVTFSGVTLAATADNNATASPTQQVSSDTMSFAFKATAIDPATDAIGTFNTYTYASGGNTATIAASAPTQTTSSMNINGIQVFARAGNATSTSASPSRVDIFIGKGLQSVNLGLFKSTSKVNSGMLDYSQADGKLDAYGLAIKDYNPTTGILQIDAGLVLYPASNTTHTLQFSDATVQTNGYVAFSASKAPVLTTVPNLQMRVAYLSDVKATATNGGASIAATWTNRELNTIVDNTGIVTSLASNQFVLSAGVYSIEASAPFFSTTTSKLRLRNITDSTTFDVSDSHYANTTTSCVPLLRTEITLTSAKTISLQYYVGAAVATNGLGTAVGGGENEKFAQVKITKIK